MNIKHKQYYWFNEPLSKEEYRRRLNDVLGSRERVEENRRTFETFAKSMPVEYATIRNSEDVSGGEIFNSRLVRSSFTIVESENISESMRIAYDGHDIYRCSFGGLGATREYECSSTPNSNSVTCSFLAGDCAFLSYCYFVINAHDLFGCVSLRKKQFCILNTQYSEEEYKKIRDQIISDMKQRGEWGEFLPMKLSPFAYNESLAHEYVPLSEKEATTKGLRWESEEWGVRGTETLLPSAIPDTIGGVDSAITKEVLRCTTCKKNYRIIRKELEHLKKLCLPVPLLCQDCRFKKRMERFFIPILYNWHCMCAENHTFHADRPCFQKFETTYRPDGQDIVYCKPCYQELLS